jgi:hypothetical protein
VPSAVPSGGRRAKGILYVPSSSPICC